MEVRKEGKEVAFQDGTYSLKTIQHIFTRCSQKTYSRENEFRFSEQNTYKFKDLKLFEVLSPVDNLLTFLVLLP